MSVRLAWRLLRQPPVAGSPKPLAASGGIGHMITDSQALLATDQITFGIIVIGLLFKQANRRKR